MSQSVLCTLYLESGLESGLALGLELVLALEWRRLLLPKQKLAR